MSSQHCSLVQGVNEDEDRSSVYTYFSDSTNATIDDQPGAGRTLGKVYQRLGRALENGLSKLMDVFSKRITTQAQTAEQERYDEISIISNETVSNQPGPGRTLDNFIFQPLGRNLEKMLGDTADRLGLGPDAAERKLFRLLGSIWVHNQGVTTSKKREKILSDASGTLIKSIS